MVAKWSGVRDAEKRNIGFDDDTLKMIRMEMEK